MKRIFILFTVMLIVLGGLFAEEAVLIDFTKLAADIIPPANQQADESAGGNQFTQNRATIMDYGRSLKDANSYTEEQRAVMRTSLALRNWEVQLASSSKSVSREVRTYTEEAPSKQYGTVLGIRVNFPTEPWNSWALVKPPFEIPAYEPTQQFDDNGNPVDGTNQGYTGLSRFEGPASENDPKKPQYGLGVLKNVGTIKSIAVNTFGLNFPHSLSVILIDNEGNQKTMFVDYLNFDGWAELRWDNPQYVQQVRNRELRLYPLYPTSTPFVKFGGFLIKRDADKAGGDFITYVRDVKVIYDKAVLDTDRDIDDEALWKIIQTREEAKKSFEMSRFGQNQILRYLEQQKQASETDFTPSPTVNAAE
jgi:hypothetical protein